MSWVLSRADMPAAPSNNQFRKGGALQCHVPVAVSRRRGVGKDVLVDPFDGVADFCRSFRRRDHQIFHRDLNGRGMRRDSAPNVSAAATGSIHLGVLTSVLAATCSVCCSWPWKILRPVCSTISGTIGTPLGARY